MPRPKKCRRICDYPQTPSFVPAEMPEPRNAVILTLEEYETIRLIDKEGLSQEQCGDFMQVAPYHCAANLFQRPKKTGGCAGGRPATAD